MITPLNRPSVPAPDPTCNLRFNAAPYKGILQSRCPCSPARALFLTRMTCRPPVLIQYWLALRLLIYAPLANIAFSKGDSSLSQSPAFQYRCVLWTTLVFPWAAPAGSGFVIVPELIVNDDSSPFALALILCIEIWWRLFYTTSRLRRLRNPSSLPRRVTPNACHVAA